MVGLVIFLAVTGALYLPCSEFSEYFDSVLEKSNTYQQSLSNQTYQLSASEKLGSWSLVFGGNFYS